MDMTSTQRIEAPRETVWAALNDPDVLKRCIPGCESNRKNLGHRDERESDSEDWSREGHIHR